MTDWFADQITRGMANDMQAVSQEMIRQRQIAEYAATMHRPSIRDLASLANYRPPVVVPKGWAEWSAYGTTY